MRFSVYIRVCKCPRNWRHTIHGKRVAQRGRNTWIFIINLTWALAFDWLASIRAISPRAEPIYLSLSTLKTRRRLGDSSVVWNKFLSNGLQDGHGEEDRFGTEGQERKWGRYLSYVPPQIVSLQVSPKTITIGFNSMSILKVEADTSGGWDLRTFRAIYGTGFQGHFLFFWFQGTLFWGKGSVVC